MVAYVETPKEIDFGEANNVLSLRNQQPRQIELPNEDIDAVGCFLEFLYTGDYFPKKVPGQRTLEKDPSVPDVDMTGDQLLKHAKVYTLADKFGLTHLKNLASSKIHCVNSTAKGEIAYARYVYEFTSKDDTSIRAPVANFWATRSHTLRAEAEDEFRNLCLEFPQFGYDVLSMFPPAGLLMLVVVLSTDLSLPQPASSTRSSSASATRRCTPAPAARARGPVTAAPPTLRKTPRTTRRLGAQRREAQRRGALRRARCISRLEAKARDREPLSLSRDGEISGRTRKDGEGLVVWFGRIHIGQKTWPPEQNNSRR